MHISESLDLVTMSDESTKSVVLFAKTSSSVFLYLSFYLSLSHARTGVRADLMKRKKTFDVRRSIITRPPAFFIHEHIYIFIVNAT